MDQWAQPGMGERQGETKPAAFFLAVNDFHTAGGEEVRQRQAAAEQFDEIVNAPKHKSLANHMNGERHADAVADIFLQSRWPTKALCRMNHMGKPALSCIETCPKLAAGAPVLRHGDDSGTL